MAQLLFKPLFHPNHTELAEIVANASFLEERLNSKRFIVDSEKLNEQEIERRYLRWCQTISHEGKPTTLEKLLQWEGLDFDAIVPRLGTVKLAAEQPLPAWAETLGQIMETAVEFNPHIEAWQPIDPEEPIPFEDILLPAIKVARKNLLAHLEVAQLSSENLPLSILAQKAYSSLERSLLQRLAALCSKTLNFEFSKVRPFGQSLLNQLGLEAENSDRKTEYHKFVHQLLENGLLNFCQTYPVLGRLMATAVDFWVEATAEFIQRLASDRVEIQQVFSAVPRKNESKGRASQPNYSLDKVSEITTSLSDPHNRGRTVILLTFESGLKLVYKPKDLGLEVAWNQFLAWCNQESQLLDLKVIQVLNRDGYGWVEYVEHQPCKDEAAVKRFYQRAGMLLCLIYALRGTDCHHENLIASGEHFVMIDMETLLHHEANLIENSPAAQELELESVQQFWDSVLRTGLLPRWFFSADNRIAYDISGLGSSDPQQSPQKTLQWQSINTDNMHLRYETQTLSIDKNVPRLGDKILSANDDRELIVIGFEQMYRFLMAHRERLLATESPLAALQHQQVRFIFRATRVYFILLQKTWAPDYLKNGADYSIELDHLSQAFLVASEKPHAWAIRKAEIRAMEQLDIPFFTARANSDRLSLNNIQEIPQYFKQPSYQQVLEQLQSLDETDLARQVAIIQGSFSARVAQATNKETQQWQGESTEILSAEELIAQAKAIANELESRAIQDPDGSLNWIGMGFVPEAERYQLQLLNDSLYDGRCGVALFLAALDRVTGDSRYGNLSLRVLQSLRQHLKTLDLESQRRFARLTGLGGATGLGSIIYALVKIAQFLGDETLLTEARVLADSIAPEMIAADRQLDIISGAAGTILGLLSLYRVTDEVSILETAIACGQHLLSQQISDRGTPKAWKTIREKPLAGFSHGAAGIAYALLRLYSITQEPNYLEAALEGIDYERSIFWATKANWPDFRELQPGKEPFFPVQWCHGAAGVGLARLGSLDILNTPEIEQEIEIALQTTQKQGVQAIDHLCCGNFGRVEVLLVGAQRYSRPDWRQVALQQATSVVARAKQTGVYRLFSNLPNSVFNPGFFQGTAGIGYELLRLANDDLPSVLLWE
ncbi:MAG: type 2 lanthipeptide synthetase LanM family protein [Pleurocapsa sp. MO_226.B13]|nr:type 2 lanthipeptide synthetase LanM family protein [Pleurocapsa sp. MO_226.B13]